MLGIFTGNCFDGDEILATGFEQLGHSVTKINFRKTPLINITLPFIAKKFDLLIIGKGDSILPLTLRQVKIPKVLWYGDQRAEVQPWLLNRVKQVDLFLQTTSGERLETYHKASKTPSAFFMVPCQEDLYPVHNAYHQDIFFAGSPISTLGDPLREQVLTELSTKPNFTWFGKTPDTVIKGPDYAKELVASKILMSINHFNDFYKYNSDRIVHYSAGSFTLAYEIPGFRTLFSNMPTFKSLDEMNDQINHYLTHDDERESLKEKIVTETREKYNTKTICSYILDLVFKNDASRYPQFDYLN